MAEVNMSMVFDKRLMRTDVSRAQNRLMIDRRDGRLMAALREEEREKVERERGFLEVIAEDEDGGVYKMRLTKWHALYGAVVLRHGWYKFIDANQLETGDTVQGWAYRTPPDDGHFRLHLKILKKIKGEIYDSYSSPE